MKKYKQKLVTFFIFVVLIITSYFIIISKQYKIAREVLYNLDQIIEKEKVEKFIDYENIKIIYFENQELLNEFATFLQNNVENGDHHWFYTVDFENKEHLGYTGSAQNNTEEAIECKIKQFCQSMYDGKMIYKNMPIDFEVYQMGEGYFTIYLKLYYFDGMYAGLFYSSDKENFTDSEYEELADDMKYIAPHWFYFKGFRYV